MVDDKNLAFVWTLIGQGGGGGYAMMMTMMLIIMMMLLMIIVTVIIITTVLISKYFVWFNSFPSVGGAVPYTTFGA